MNMKMDYQKNPRSRKYSKKKVSQKSKNLTKDFQNEHENGLSKNPRSRKYSKKKVSPDPKI